MKIGILGGSFDPPHFGHLSVARQLLVNNLVDEIWLVPCFSHAFEKKMSGSESRLAMVKLLEEDKIKISDREVSQHKVSYTIDTMDFFTKNFQDDEFYWIMGSDQLFVFEKYHKWQDIIKKHNLIIYPRVKDFEKICNFVDYLVGIVGTSEKIIILDPKEFQTKEISSTEIRECLKKGENVSKMIPPEIEKYIKNNKLYL